MEDQELLTVEEAAKEKQTHVKSVYRAIQEGRLKAERRGKRILLLRRVDLNAWEPSRRMKEAAKRARAAPIGEKPPSNDGGPLLQTGSLSKQTSVAIHNAF